MNEKKIISHDIDDAYIPNTEGIVEVSVPLQEALDDGAIEEKAISLEDVLSASNELIEV